MSDPLLKITNHHTASCGDPPIIDDSIAETSYVGYFENSHGEQWIFTRNRATGKATLQGGDAGWDTEFDVVDGTAVDLILNQAEQLWLRACWLSSQKQLIGV